MLDSQADISILKLSALPQDFQINKTETVFIRGVTGERQTSLGTAKVCLKIKHLIIEIKLHVVSNDFLIPSHGILGRDFLRNFDCLIDYAQNTVTIRPNGVPEAQIPLEIELTRGVSALPPRSETFKLFHITASEFPCVIPAQEVD